MKKVDQVTRKNLFMAVQAAVCAAIAVLLAAGALSLYFDGAARQAEGDLFYYMFTRERVGEKLLPVLPLFCCAVGMTIAGVILGIQDGNEAMPVKSEKLLRDIGGIRERAVRRHEGRKTVMLHLLL